MKRRDLFKAMPAAAAAGITAAMTAPGPIAQAANAYTDSLRQVAAIEIALPVADFVFLRLYRD